MKKKNAVVLYSIAHDWSNEASLPEKAKYSRQEVHLTPMLSSSLALHLLLYINSSLQELHSLRKFHLHYNFYRMKLPQRIIVTLYQFFIIMLFKAIWSKYLCNSINLCPLSITRLKWGNFTKDWLESTIISVKEVGNWDLF